MGYSLQKMLPSIRAFQGQVMHLLILAEMTKMQQQTAFFDTPLHENFHQASKSGSSYDLRHILDNSLVVIRPGDAVTFVDNHE